MAKEDAGYCSAFEFEGKAIRCRRAVDELVQIIGDESISSEKLIRCSPMLSISCIGVRVML